MDAVITSAAHMVLIHYGRRSRLTSSVAVLHIDNTELTKTERAVTTEQQGESVLIMSGKRG